MASKAEKRKRRQRAGGGGAPVATPRPTVAAKTRAAAAVAAAREERGGVEEGYHRSSDLGAPLAILRGLVEYDTQASVPRDPDDARTLREVAARAKRVWAPETLSKGRNPMVDQARLMAATRLYDDYLIGHIGARKGRGDGTYTAPWNRMPFSEARILRRRSFNRAMTLLGPLQRDVVTWAVLQITDAPNTPPTIEAWAKTMSWTKHRASGFLGATLETLAAHYGYCRKPSTQERWAEAVEAETGSEASLDAEGTPTPSPPSPQGAP